MSRGTPNCSPPSTRNPKCRRLDSQVSIGGTTVDLTEVEQTLAALPEVAEAVVVCDGDIEAYLALAPLSTVAEVQAAVTRELAAVRRPRRLHVLDALPRTASGKLVRSPVALREAITGDNGGNTR